MHADLVATYRLQLHADFDLEAAAEQVAYLASLGVSHLYLSPVLQAAPGSTHGYDVSDPAEVNEAIGGEDALRRLFDRLRESGMAAVIDIVPNHMAAVPENPYWWDVLKNGRDSRYAWFFDIDWSPPDPELRDKVLVPVLGDHLGAVLARGEIRVVERDGEPELSYFDHRLPLNAAGAELVRQGERDPATLLEIQHYRLAFWRTGAEEINYRRFFDIATLAGVRVEDPDVFDATHKKLLELAEEGPVDGFRIDHPDGLRDPRGYFLRLRDAVPALWIVVEKILEPGERLRPDWPVDGTTGYDFLQRVGGLAIDPEGEKSISDFYADFTGHTEPYGALVRGKKRTVLELGFDGDLRRLVETLHAVCQHPEVRLDHSRRQLRHALGEIVASFPVYRTYVHPGRGEIAEDDLEAISHALESARRRDLPIDAGLIDFLEDLLTGKRTVGPLGEEFVARFQQLTSPVMAKGVEDTTFYTYDRLLALNEVGCDPARFGVSPEAFHEACTQAHREWPRAMLALSTHDTKRSEDVRARLSLLSEMPEAWAEEVRRWSDHNATAWSGREPDRNAEHLLYQTLAGAWPIETPRVVDYMRKACREAKTHTSWTDPDVEYEERIAAFVTTVLGDEEFVAMLEAFVAPLVEPGRMNSLAQTLIKLTAPGIPDIYQGCELWDNSLVDPDNRRPVDYEVRRRLLEELENLSPEEIAERSDGGLPKLHVIRQALALRRRIPQAFGPAEAGAYAPLAVAGAKLRHAVAFTRGDDVTVVVPRLPLRLGGDWSDTSISLGEGVWRNVMDGTTHQGQVPLARLLAPIPVALLERVKNRA